MEASYLRSLTLLASLRIWTDAEIQAVNTICRDLEFSVRADEPTGVAGVRADHHHGGADAAWFRKGRRRASLTKVLDEDDIPTQSSAREGQTCSVGAVRERKDPIAL
jgi:hypothetical protein